MRNFGLMGQYALYCFIIANVYFPAKMLYRQVLKNSPISQKVLDKYLYIHILFNLVGMFALFFHGHFAGQRNFVLQGGFVLMVWLTASGFILYKKYTPESKYRTSALAIQQILFILAIFMFGIGHGLLN